jgi:enamine deaminase RidA (YjgF/YER057c/UK114 family)
VVDGDRVHVSGTTGFDYRTMTISDDVVEQAERALDNIGAALAEAGCTFADVLRVRYLLPDRADFEPCWPVLRRRFGDARPAATMQVCGLADPRMRIEIEVDARRGSGGA